MTHKERCKELKGIRKVLADKLGIDLKQTECKYQGECKGTCPKCEKEESILKKALLSGAVGLTAVTLAACGTDSGDDVSNRDRIEQRKSACEKENKKDNKKKGEPIDNPLAGDVEIIEIEGDEAYDPDLDVEGEFVENGGSGSYGGDDEFPLEGDVAMPVEESYSEYCLSHYNKNYNDDELDTYAEFDFYDKNGIAHIKIYAAADNGEEIVEVYTVDPETLDCTNQAGDVFILWE